MEAELARHARTLDAGQLAVLGKRIPAYLDQDGPRPQDTPETRRRLSFHDRDRDGGYELAGWLDREAAEIVIMWSIGPTTDQPASETALHSAVDTIDLSTIPTGESRWPTVFQNFIHHHGWAGLHAATPSTSAPS